MAFSDVFNAKFVNDEIEEDGSPFVAQEDGSGGTLVVSVYVEAFFGELVF